MKQSYPLLAFLFLLGLLAACTDDDSFSTSPANRLTFSTDTLRLDTTFSNVPTPTKSFWVYNHSGDGIRLTTVRLERGNQSGFRVNVDGVYLGQSSGFQTNEVEVRKDDSIRVFVELTSAYNHQDTPQLVSDNLVFTLESGVEQRVNLNAYSWDALLVNGLDIDHDTTIVSERPIVIYRGIDIDSAATLTIGPGTTLYFHENAGVNVDGRLRTLGQPGREVTLRGDRIDHMFDYLPYDRTPGQWRGIRFGANSYDNEMEYTDLHSAYDGIVCDSATDSTRQKLTLRQVTVHNCQGYGLTAMNCKITAHNTLISNTLRDCLELRGGVVELNHCTLAQFYPFDASRMAAIRFANDTPLHLSVANSLITGYADDVLMGERADTTMAFDYHFDHCIIRTPKVTSADSAYFTQVIFEDVADTARFADKHFKLVDTDNLRYDFRLDSISPAVNAANVETALPVDRDGAARDSLPDIGAYEYRLPAQANKIRRLWKTGN